MEQLNREVTSLVEHLFREEAGKLYAVLIRIFGLGQPELAEDIIQETFYTALKSWSHNEIPDNPSAWLMQVAKNKTLNTIKREKRKRPLNQKEPGETNRYEMDRLFTEREIKDSQLRLLFSCCQPSLSEKVQIIFTLRTLCGFGISEIASALLMTSEAVKKSLYRARKSLRDFKEPPAIPMKQEARKHLEEARTVLYLLFNEGYKSSNGDKIIREDLCLEAIRLARLLADFEDEGDESGATHALLSLFYFNLARFEARVTEDGKILDLSMQDRKKWDRQLIQEGFNHLKMSRKSMKLSRYHVEAGIASVHCMAEDFNETDWDSILRYYDRLLDLLDNPVIRINRAIVLSYCRNIDAGISALEEVSNKLLPRSGAMFQFYAAKADMLFRKKDYDSAKSYYRVSLDLADTEAERSFIEKKIETCDRLNISGN